MEFPTPPKRLCVIRLSAIGDTCHALAVVRAIQAAWPSTEITWVIGKTEAALLGDIDSVRFVEFNKSDGFGALLDLRRRLKDPFDVVLHMHASMRANLVSLCCRAPIKIGFDRSRARDFQGWFVNRRIEPIKQQHVLDGFFEFAKSVGVPRRELRWDIPLSAEDKAFAKSQVSAGPVVLISPCSSQRFRNYRNWSINHYREVIGELVSRLGCSVVLTGGPSELEQTYGDALVEGNPSVNNLVARTTLKQLLALIELADVVICPDSGPAHMATAVGTPVVGLYATSNTKRTGPYLSQHLVVDKYEEALSNAMDKTVNEVSWGQRVRAPDAMNLIRPQEVIEKVEQVLSGL